ncbi:ORF99 [Agrotis segetum granulovirus]|uniref:ORF99 n=1 Tax=Agrotis segetum granulosis virus TaxID=10464 RepID=Q6QXL9_GVAS|nr:hypothetical protein AsGV113 [Agrotis segetum granulovirus]AAS82639.1 ORF99 [Agrotis segetum granulovirus]AHN92149.1 hypothetical protein AsGV110 [Agrotis segetum granulovirus]AKN63387.1 hypothetical protein AsGV113 [Agrotis segetum granulovirus]
MSIITPVIALVVLAFLLNTAFRGSELIITILVLLVLFFCVLHIHYVNNESGPDTLFNEQTKKLKKKQQINDAFDAILNKNNSSLE